MPGIRRGRFVHPLGPHAMSAETLCPDCGHPMRLHSKIAGCPVQYTSMTYYEDGSVEVRTFPPGPPITLDDLSKLGQSEAKPINQWGYPIYPVGTPIAEVSIRDRGQKLIFACDLHPEVTWASKDPFVSRWFGNPEQTPACNCPTEHFFLTQPYSPSRND